MAGVVPGLIVLEVLNQDNYEQWRLRVKTYLLAEDLWETIESDPPSRDDHEKFKIWARNNSRALHAIHISCGSDIFTFIKDIEDAKHAWDTLEKQFMGQIQNFAKPGSEESDQPPISGFKSFLKDVRRGDWEAAQEFLTLHPEAVRARRSSDGATGLHVAVVTGQLHIVEKLLLLMTDRDLEITDRYGQTPFIHALHMGSLQMVRCVVEKNKQIVTKRLAPDDVTPVLVASCIEKWEIASYLYSVTPPESLTQDHDGLDGAELISQCFYTKKFDIAWDLIKKYPTLALTKDHFGHSPFNALAGVQSAFLSGKRLKFWQHWIYNCIRIQSTPTTNDISVNIVEKEEDDDQGNQKDLIRSVKGSFQGLAKNNILLKLPAINRIYEMKLAHVRTQEILGCMCEAFKNKDINPTQTSFLHTSIFRAVERGHIEFITHICKEKPDIRKITDGQDRTIFHYAIECRQEKIYNLIHKLDDNRRKKVVNAADRFNNGMLHAAANLSARLNHIQGAALQMQRELQWFKEVERRVPPMAREIINSTHRMTAHELFSKNHKKLMTEGETSMKATATSCTVVGALIVTMMFAAAFTFPGGNEDTGFPKFMGKKLFTVFIIADSVSLFSSTTSVMIFLGILTSRYAEEDFLKSLPTKMILGLLTLFFSIASMMIAFSSALVLLLDNESWIKPVISLAGLPITTFVMMQFPLLVDLCVSTYGVGLFGKKIKHKY